jgi:hypothetical protein
LFGRTVQFPKPHKKKSSIMQHRESFLADKINTLRFCFPSIMVPNFQVNWFY